MLSLAQLHAAMFSIKYQGCSLMYCNAITQLKIAPQKIWDGIKQWHQRCCHGKSITRTRLKMRQSDQEILPSPRLSTVLAPTISWNSLSGRITYQTCSLIHSDSDMEFLNSNFQLELLPTCRWIPPILIPYHAWKQVHAPCFLAVRFRFDNVFAVLALSEKKLA